MQKRRILFVLENYYPNIGGVETLFKSLAESLVERGSQVTVLTNKFDRTLPAEETINGVDIVRVNFKNRYLFTFFAWIKASKLAKSHDFIHTTSYNAALPAFIASLIRRKKILITFHEVWAKLWFELPFMNKLALTLHFLFEWFILKLPFDKFIAVSDSTKNALINAGVHQEKVIRVYNGIDYSEFESSDHSTKDKDGFQFLYFGRLGISKGIDLILDAVSLLKKEHSGFSLTLVIPTLPSGFLNTIKKMIINKNIGDLINIKHELSFNELKDNIRLSDAVLIPSYSEGFCYAAVETMAIGTPIISSGKAALAEVIGGHYLEMKDQSAVALSECMIKAMQGEWNTKALKQFQLSEAVEAYQNIYDQLNS